MAYKSVALWLDSAYFVICCFTNTKKSEEFIMKRAIAMGILLMTTLLLVSGCNTIRGAGEDIEQGGEAIQRSAS